MMVLRENSPLEMLRQFATYFKTKTSESIGAAKLSFDNSLGKGYISLYEVFPGLSVWVYNFNLKKELYFTFEFIPRGPIYFGYNVEGYQHHKLDEEEKFLMINQNQNFIIKGEPGAMGHFKMPCNIPYKSCYLIVNPDKINAHEGIGSRSISQNINDITTSCGGGQSYRHLGELDMTTGLYAQILVNNETTDLIGRLKTEGAVMNLLAAQVAAHNHAISGPKFDTELKKSEMAKIETLGSHILNNLQNNILMDDLSKYLGLSPKKIQKGIKTMFGTTTNGYFVRLRMEYAKELMHSTEDNISEICYRVGYSSRSHFSNVFRETFGLLPSKYQEAIRTKVL